MRAKLGSTCGIASLQDKLTAILSHVCGFARYSFFAWCSLSCGQICCPTPNGRLVCPVLEFLLCESRENTEGHKTIGKEIVGLVLVCNACVEGTEVQGPGPMCNEQEWVGLSEESPVSTLLQPTKKENVFSEQGHCARLSVAPAPAECQATAPIAGVHLTKFCRVPRRTGSW